VVLTELFKSSLITRLLVRHSSLFKTKPIQTNH